jgi:ABC-type multidrug transport system permease subunit
MLRSTWFVARKDLGFMLRQKETLLWVFVMPFLFFYFIGTVTAGFGAPSGSERTAAPLALSAPDGNDPLVAELVRALEERDFAVERARTPEELAAFERRLIAPELPAGRARLVDSVLAGEPVALRFERDEAGLAAQSERVRVARAVYGLLAELAVLASEGREIDAESFRGLRADPRPLALEVRSAGERVTIPTGFEQTIPGTLVMFTMLVLLSSGSILLVIERQQGLLRRLASTPIPRAALVAGKWWGRMALGLVQIGFAMLVGTLVFGMDWGDSLAMILAVLFAWAAFNASLGILLGNLARSEAQMTGIGVLATLVLAALGGCWWPIEITPAWMQTLALALPTGWAMDAMHRLASFGHGPGSAVAHLAALLAGALLLGGLAVRTFRYL